MLFVKLLPVFALSVSLVVSKKTKESIQNDDNTQTTEELVEQLQAKLEHMELNMNQKINKLRMEMTEKDKQHDLDIKKCIKQAKLNDFQNNTVEELDERLTELEVDFEFLSQQVSTTQ